MQVIAENNSGFNCAAAWEIQMSETQLPPPHSSLYHALSYELLSLSCTCQAFKLANDFSYVHEHQHLLLAASFIQFMLSIFKCYVWTFPACSASHIVLRCLHGLLLVLWWTTDILLITLLSSWLSATVLGAPVVQLHSCNRFPAFQACTWRQYFWEAVYCPKFDFKNLFYLMYKPLPQSHLLLEKRLNFAFGYLDVS